MTFTSVDSRKNHEKGKCERKDQVFAKTKNKKQKTKNKKQKTKNKKQKTKNKKQKTKKLKSKMFQKVMTS